MNKYLTLGICVLLIANVLSSLSISAADSVMDHATFEDVNATTMQEDVGHFYDIYPTDNIISVNGFKFDCLKEEPVIQEGLRAIEPRFGEIGLYIIHFSCSINQEIYDTIKALNITIAGYVHYNAYKVRMTPEQALLAENLSFVDWVGFYHPAYKISGDLKPGQLELAVWLYGQEIPYEAIQEVRSKFDSIEWEGYLLGDGVHDEYLFKGILSSFEAKKETATNPYVHYIYPILRGHFMDEAAIQIVGGGLWVDDNDANHNTPYRVHGSLGSRFNQITNLSGQGLTIGIADSGLGDGTVGNAGHPDFGNRIIGGMSYVGGGWGDTFGHGTHCAGLIAANGFSGTGITYNGYGPYYAGMGLAYDANLFVQKIAANNPPSDVGIILRDAEAAGVQIHSNSWGDNIGGSYSEWDRAFDQRTRDADPSPNNPGNQQILVIVAAGNAGPNGTTIGSPGNAKNVITVGGTENYMPDSLSFGNTNPRNTVNPDAIDSHSSRGWTSDGRIKPDIVAPGENILSTRSPNAPINSLYGTYTADNWYEWSSGTSSATPIVAGGAAVVYQWFLEKTLWDPTPAMTKALLINTAKAMGDIPNRDEGWGRMYLTPFADNPDLFFVRDQMNARKLTNGDWHDYKLAYMDDNQPLKVTLVWTDPAAELNADPALMNDLNLQVTTPGGTVYKGNVFGGGWSALGGTHDSRNNVECVYIPPGSLQTGKYTIRISGANIRADCDGSGYANQDYALVVYNGMEDDWPPESAVTPSTPYWRKDSSISITASASDISGVNNVKLHYRYRPNTGTAWPNDWTFFGTDTAAPWEWSFPWPSGQGHYQFHTIATDNAGNVEGAKTAAEAEYGYDSTAPDTPALLSPSDGQSFTVTSVTLDWSTCYDTQYGSGMKHYVVYFSDNKGGSTSWTTTASQYTVGSLSYGTTYYWQVRAVDNAGNYATSPTRSFSVHEPATSGALSGYVYNSGTGAGISDATVDYYYSPTGGPGGGDMLMGSGGDGNTVSATTDGNGYYVIYNVPVGYHDFYAAASGYNTAYAYDVYVPETGASRNFYLSSSSGGDDGGGGTCFVKGTVISTPAGDVNIEDIRAGDYVLSFNEKTGEIEPKMVSGMVSHPPQEYLLVNGILGVTENHIVHVNGEWKPAGDLRTGDMLTALDGHAEVTSIESVTLPLEVFNIEVEGNHNFFADGFLVHNAKYPPTFPPECGIEACPFVMTWNGTDYVTDNNLLSLSSVPERNDLDVDDYHIIESESIPIDGNYSFLLTERKEYQSRIDKMTLAVVDCPEELEVGVTSDGEWVTYSEESTIAPISALDSNNIDPLWCIEHEDGDYAEYGAGGFVVLSFGELGDISEAKLIVRRRNSPVPPVFMPGARPWWWFLCKHPMEVQIHDDTGAWTTIGIIPTRVNWATGVADLTPAIEYIRNGGSIRLLITAGWRQIDFVGLDVSNTQLLDVKYYPPEYASYLGSDEDIHESLLHTDGNYFVLNPHTRAEVRFPYIPSTGGKRVMALMSHGYYYHLPEIDIEQPVRIQATVHGCSSGSATLWLDEIWEGGVARGMVGQSIDLSINPEADFRLSFIQNTRRSYQLRARFDGCGPGAFMTATVSSYRGSQTIRIYSNGDIDRIILLEDILWNVTGVSFDEFFGKFQVLKNTLLQFDINKVYGYDTSTWSNYNWNFGEGLWTRDTRPTFRYDTLGIYNPYMYALSDAGETLFIAHAMIEIVESPPIPVIDISQAVELALTVAGRKDNAVGVRIYEGGILIHSADVTRTAGQPDTVTLEFNRYLGRLYEVELVYDATQKGANPTRLTFSSGDASLTYFKEFNTKDGFSQAITVPASYLEEAVAANPAYSFDASGSYDIDGEIVSYEWDFGDGAVAEGMAVQHTYSAPGTYEVMLTVTDDDGLAAVKTIIIVCAVPVTVQPYPQRFTPLI